MKSFPGCSSSRKMRVDTRGELAREEGGIKSRLRTSCSPGAGGGRGVGGRFAVPAAVPPKCQLRGPGLCPERGHSWPAAAGCHRER